ncbi:MAG: hypothetical protein ABFD89_01015 [Bryobacteraceae bacterium]
MADDIQVTISQDSVKQIIEAKVQAAVADALRPHGNQLVDEIVKKALNAKSTAEEYRYANQAPTVFAHMVTEMIREETKLALQEWVKENRAQVSKRIRESMRRNMGWANQLADQLLESMATANKYEFQVQVTPKKD